MGNEVVEGTRVGSVGRRPVPKDSGRYFASRVQRYTHDSGLKFADRRGLIKEIQQQSEEVATGSIDACLAVAAAAQLLYPMLKSGLQRSGVAGVQEARGGGFRATKHKTGGFE